MRRGAAHSAREPFSVEVRRCPVQSGAPCGDLALPTAGEHDGEDDEEEEGEEEGGEQEEGEEEGQLT